MAVLFFDHWYCENGLPLDFITDRDTLFTSEFWKAFNKLTGVKLKMSTAYHPETDGSSERTNKTINQLLRYEVDRAQKDWVSALPRVRFALMNTINNLTGFLPFQLKMGRSPRIIPPLVETALADADDEGDAAVTAVEIIHQLERDVKVAQDHLLKSKTDQAIYANWRRGKELAYEVGQKVMKNTLHKRQAFKSAGEYRVAKWFPRFDGPYLVTSAHPETSTYVLKLPDSDVPEETFHARLLKPYKSNNPLLFPDRANQRPQPAPILNEKGEEEYLVEKIVEEKKWGKGRRFLVRWQGYGPEADRWVPGSEMEDTEALDIWEHRERR